MLLAAGGAFTMRRGEAVGAGLMLGLQLSPFAGRQDGRNDSDLRGLDQLGGVVAHVADRLGHDVVVQGLGHCRRGVDRGIQHITDVVGRGIEPCVGVIRINRLRVPGAQGTPLTAQSRTTSSDLATPSARPCTTTLHPW